jgi:hypothetical protein
MFLVLSAPLGGCRISHPDDQAAVYKTLDQHFLSNVEVSEDRGAGVITLRGVVVTAASKAAAEQFARQAAPGYTVKNQIQVKRNG